MKRFQPKFIHALVAIAALGGCRADLLADPALAGAEVADSAADETSLPTDAVAPDAALPDAAIETAAPDVADEETAVDVQSADSPSEDTPIDLWPSEDAESDTATDTPAPIDIVGEDAPDAAAEVGPDAVANDVVALDSAEVVAEVVADVGADLDAGNPCPAGCDDKKICTDDTCAANGCEHTNNALKCDDGDPCTLGDGCADGKCAAGKPACNDNEACTADSCDKITGKCSYLAIACTKPACSANLDCPGGVCDPSANACVGCIGDKNCSGNTPVCVAGVCVAGIVCGTDKDCQNNKQVCDKVAGHCVDCLSENECPGAMCSKRKCVPKIACKSTLECPNNQVCATLSKICVACNDANDCLSTHYCDADATCQPKVCLSDSCFKGSFFGCKADGTGFVAGKSCDDGNVCSQDVCDPKANCSHPNQVDGYGCDDGKGCAGDLCAAGTCKGVPLAVDVTFGTSPTERVDRVAASEDGGFVGVGRISAQVINKLNYQSWLFKVDTMGKLLWSTQVAPVGGYHYSAVVSDGKGGLVAFANSSPPLTRAIHLGADGKELWSKTYGDVVYAGVYTAVEHAALLPSGKMVAVGTGYFDAEGKPAANGSQQRALWLIDGDGKLLLTKALEPGANPAFGHLYDVAVTPDGQIAVGGIAYNPKVNGQRSWVGLLSASTLEIQGQWSKEGDPNPFESIAVLPGGELVATVGQITGGYEIVRLSKDLQYQTSKTHVGVQPYSQLLTTPSGQLGLVGPLLAQSLPPLLNAKGKGDGRLMLLNPPTLEQLSDTGYGTPGDDDFKTGAGTADGFALFGAKSGPAGKVGGWMLRPDAAGNTECACIGGGGTKSCNDNNPCTLDSCDPFKGCVHSNLADTAPCDDGNPYTTANSCKIGQCTGCVQGFRTDAGLAQALFRSVVAADGSSRTNAYSAANGNSSAVVNIGKDGKVKGSKSLPDFANAADVVTALTVRSDGAVAVTAVAKDKQWKHFGFLGDGTPMNPESTILIAYNAVNVADFGFAWTKNGQILDFHYAPPTSGLIEYKRNWGFFSNNLAASWVDEFPTGNGFNFWPGSNDGDVLACNYSNNGTTAYFSRRTGSTDSWTKAIAVAVDAAAFCPPYVGYDGVIVLAKDSNELKIARVFDSKGVAGWTSKDPFVTDAKGFAAINGELYAYGIQPIDGNYAIGQWYVSHIDVAGKSAPAVLMGKPGTFYVESSPLAARVIGNGLVIVGETFFKPEPLLGSVRAIRAEFDVTKGFVCQP